MASQALDAEGALASNQFLHIVTVRAISMETGLVEQTLDAATGADLVGEFFVIADRPAHMGMPAAAQDEGRRAAYPGHGQANRPDPVLAPPRTFCAGLGF